MPVSLLGRCYCYLPPILRDLPDLGAAISLVAHEPNAFVDGWWGQCEAFSVAKGRIERRN